MSGLIAAAVGTVLVSSLSIILSQLVMLGIVILGIIGAVWWLFFRKSGSD